VLTKLLAVWLRHVKEKMTRVRAVLRRKEKQGPPRGPLGKLTKKKEPLRNPNLKRNLIVDEVDQWEIVNNYRSLPRPYRHSVH